jgi:hypothetical protein
VAVPDWEPATGAEAAMRDALRVHDQEQYFRILSGSELLLPVSPEALAGRSATGWGTWSSEGRTHLLAFTSPQALNACLAEHAGSYRSMRYDELAEAWPNTDWWLAVNPGLPIEAYLPSWFVTQVNRGDVRLPGRTLGARARIEHADALRTRATAQVPLRTVPAARAEPSLPAARPEPSLPVPSQLAAEPPAPVPGPPALAPVPLPPSPLRRPEPAPVPQPAASQPAPVPQPAAPPPAVPAETRTGLPRRQPRPVDPLITGTIVPAGVPLPPPVPAAVDVERDLPRRRPRAQMPDVAAEPLVRAVSPVRGRADAPMGADPNGLERHSLLGPPVPPPPVAPLPTPYGLEQPTAPPVEIVDAGMPLEIGERATELVDVRPPVVANEETAAPAPMDQTAGTGAFRTARHAEDFRPANSTEETLLNAAEDGNTDSFLSTLLLAKVLVPGGTDADALLADPSLWSTEEIEDTTYVVVFTSDERMSEHAGDLAAAWVKFTQLIRAWPDEALSFAVNPGTPVGATLPGAQIVALATWATEVGLVDERPEVEPDESEQPPPDGDAYRSFVPPPVERPVVMQKMISTEQLAYYLERGYDRVSGFVHRAEEVAHLRSPELLYTALGLCYAGSPFKPDDNEVYILRWMAYRGNLYRIPYGGQHEAAMRAMQGWVIERAPFRGNGFAPSEGRDVIAEFKVDSARLPHGSQLWQLDRDGHELLIATLDTDGPRWYRVGEHDRTPA